MPDARLADGFHDVPPGKLACIVTSLEMRVRPPETRMPDPAGLRLRHERKPATDWYRQLFRTVGQDWLWWSHLDLSDDTLAATIGDPAVEVWALARDGLDLGLLELDFRTEGECELLYFGVAPGLTGQGVGRWMMQTAIERAWSQPIRRFWVHTCTLDHPSALSFYQKCGFTPFRQQVEISDDPRALGLLPTEAAPHIPRL